jgi:glycosyltransferase involved in cell wall biosynthesis/Tfp pilus assembly protein PilF
MPPHARREAAEMSDREGTMERPLLSLTMIVRNEEEHLDRCLASVRGIADELIVVDTGSTDRTVEIARAHGARVYHFKWCDDFAAARNVSLQHATAEWCLHLDADEWVVETGPGALRAELARQGDERYFLRVPVKSLMSGGLGRSVYGSNRLYRNRPDVTWIRPIHENVVKVGPSTAGLEASCGSIAIEHDGYADPTPERAAARNRRNARILRRALRQTPDDATLYYYLSIEMNLTKRPAAGLRWAREGIRRFADKIRPDFAGALYCQAIRSAGAAGKPRLAIKIGLEGASHYAYSELCYLLAAQFQVVNDFVNAEKYYELALLLRPRFAEYQMEAGCGSWKAQLGLAGVAWDQGKIDLAVERAARALEWAPEEPLVQFLYGKTLLAAGQPEAAESYLRHAIEHAPTLHEAVLRLSQALLMLERAQEAYDLLDRRAHESPDVVEYWRWLGGFLYELGEYQACANALGAAIERHQDSAEIYERLGQALSKLGRNQDALNAYALAAALDPGSKSARAGLGLAAFAVEWDVVRGRLAGEPAAAER